MISKLLLNGKIPTREEYDQFKQLHLNEIPTNFEIGGTWDYEENMEWDDCTFTWSNGDTLNWAAYWGLWELRSFHRLKDEYQLEIIKDMFEYIDYEWNDLVERWEEQENDD
jgi:hypothetical protein